MKKVLIIDDDALITRIYERHFRADGFEVRIARTGNEGLVAIREFLPDAALLDLNMPDGSGVQWLERIRSDARFARLPVLVFTAGTIAWQVWAASKSDVSFVFKAGAVPKDIVKAIKRALAVAALQRPPARRADVAGGIERPGP